MAETINVTTRLDREGVRLKNVSVKIGGALLPIMLVEQGIKSKTCHILR